MEKEIIVKKKKAVGEGVFFLFLTLFYLAGCLSLRSWQKVSEIMYNCIGTLQPLQNRIRSNWFYATLSTHHSLNTYTRACTHAHTHTNTCTWVIMKITLVASGSDRIFSHG